MTGTASVEAMSNVKAPWPTQLGTNKVPSKLGLGTKASDVVVRKSSQLKFCQANVDATDMGAGCYEVVKGPRKPPAAPTLNPSTSLDKFTMTHSNDTSAGLASLQRPPPGIYGAKSSESPTATISPPPLHFPTKIVLNPALERARFKSNTLLMVVIGTVVIAGLLIVGLAVALYFSIFQHGGSSKEDVITADSLCQAQYGKCAFFSGTYPKKCTMRIPCYFRCYYPTADLTKMVYKNKTFRDKYYVAGKDGLICGERSTCQEGDCKITSAYAYVYKPRPQLVRGCINETYGSGYPQCIDADRCHKRKRFCKINGQIRIGFNISFDDDEIDSYRISPIMCDKPCGEGQNLPSVSTYLYRKKCTYKSLGGCRYKCNGDKPGSNSHHLPAGSPCNASHQGYCWKDRCFESAIFQPSKRYEHKSRHGKSCYNLGNGTLCLLGQTGATCHEASGDSYRKTTTRYGSSCLSWDMSKAIPERSHRPGCVLNHKRMPWCYSANKHLKWNYCYNPCPNTSVYRKDPNAIRVMTFSYTLDAEKTFANKAAQYFIDLGADIIVFNMWPWAPSQSKIMADLVNQLNVHPKPGQTWKLCGDRTKANVSYILLKGSQAPTQLTFKVANHSVGCKVTMKLGTGRKEFAVVATTVEPEPIDIPTGCSVDSNTAKKYETQNKIRLKKVQGLMNAIKDDPSLKSSSGGIDVILAGTFGQISHLDWNTEVAALHCNKSLNSSISNYMYNQGFTDSYRNLHPDPLFWPGIVFSTRPEDKDRQQARYDYQYFKGPNIKPARATTFPLMEPSTYLKNNWPSRKYSVIVDYKFD